jgi:hypothetical protein
MASSKALGFSAKSKGESWPNYLAKRNRHGLREARENKREF